MRRSRASSAAEKGSTVSRETILNEVWGIEYCGAARTLEQLAIKLRRKIEDVPGEPRHLLTAHGSATGWMVARVEEAQG